MGDPAPRTVVSGLVKYIPIENMRVRPRPAMVAAAERKALSARPFGAAHWSPCAPPGPARHCAGEPQAGHVCGAGSVGVQRAGSLTVWATRLHAVQHGRPACAASSRRPWSCAPRARTATPSSSCGPRRARSPATASTLRASRVRRAPPHAARCGTRPPVAQGVPGPSWAGSYLAGTPDPVLNPKKKVRCRAPRRRARTCVRLTLTRRPPLRRPCRGAATGLRDRSAGLHHDRGARGRVEGRAVPYRARRRNSDHGGEGHHQISCPVYAACDLRAPA